MRLRGEGRESKVASIVDSDDSRQIADLVDLEDSTAVSERLRPLMASGIAPQTYVVRCAEDCDALAAVFDGVAILADLMRANDSREPVELEKLPGNVRAKSKADTLEKRERDTL